MNARHRTRPPALGLSAFRLALLSHPKRMRDAMAEEMMETFRMRASDASALLGPLGLLSFWVREIWAVFLSGLRLRAPRRRSRSAHGASGRGGPGSGPGIGWLDGILSDLRLALRGLRRTPGFALSAAATLALGIGANTTAFSALRVAVLSPPPFPEVERMVLVDMLRRSGSQERSGRWPYPMLIALQELDDRLVDPVAGFDDGVVTLTGMGPASRVQMEIVSPGYFQVVGRPLTLGRGFTAEEGEESGPFRAVVVSHAFWRGRLGGDRSALGRTLELEGEPFTVVGVAPPGFTGLGADAELWLPLGATALLRPGRRAQPYNHQLWVAGRLRPGASLSAARAQLASIAEGISDTWPSDRYGLSARPISEVWSNSRATTMSKLLSLGAALVLLVACANLSGLLLTRVRRKAREGSVRLALGAPRWRLIRLSLVESLVISSLGGLAGVGLAVLGARWIARSWPATFIFGSSTGLRVAEPDALALDGSALGFSLAVVLFSAMVVSVAPALKTANGSPAEGLRESSRMTGGRRRPLGLDGRGLLVGFQVAVALVLLVGAGLVGESVRRLMGVDEGFRTDHLLTFDYSPPQRLPILDYMNGETVEDAIRAAADFDDALLERITALPEVEAATLGCRVLQGYCAVIGLQGVDGRLFEDQPSIGVISAQEDYFETLDIPILRGRGFTRDDGMESQPVVVLSQNAAELYFPGQDPVGHTIATGFALPGREWLEIVGVVGDVLFGRPDSDGYPVAYRPTRQLRFANHALVRTTGQPGQAVQAIRNEIFNLDPTVAISDVASADELVSRSAGDRRMILGLLGLFALVTLLLAAVGTWGVVSHSVADRHRELSLRMALGAHPREVLGLVTRGTLINATVALLAGTALALAGTRMLESFLWEITARDPGAYLAGAGTLLGVVLLSTLVPALRAVRMDPAQALKAD